MLSFNYECQKCFIRKDNELVSKYDDDVICECGTKMLKVFNGTKVGVVVFPADGVHLEHVSPNGETFHSKDEMRHYAKENDLELGYL